MTLKMRFLTMRPSKMFLSPLAAAAVLAILYQSFGQAAPAPSCRPLLVTWQFDTRADKDLTPHTNVFLRVSGKRFLVLRGSTAEFQVIKQQEYKDHKVPAEAIAACAGWFAGQGDDLYVIRRAGKLIVFDRALDEQEATPPFKRLQVISLR